jgi:hypothetical protein
LSRQPLLENEEQALGERGSYNRISVSQVYIKVRWLPIQLYVYEVTVSNLGMQTIYPGRILYVFYGFPYFFRVKNGTSFQIIPW